MFSVFKMAECGRSRSILYGIHCKWILNKKIIDPTIISFTVTLYMILFEFDEKRIF